MAKVFDGIPVPERVAQVQAVLGHASPVRPLCLTPAEFQLAARGRGLVMAAASSGVDLC